MARKKEQPHLRTSYLLLSGQSFDSHPPGSFVCLASTLSKSAVGNM